MRECTRIVTIEFITIDKVEDAPAPFPVKDVEKGMKELLEVDNVHVVRIQDFLGEEE